MSANNHDNGDPNNVRYAKKAPQLKDGDSQKGMLIHVYANTIQKPFTEWLKWMEEQGYALTKKS